MLVFDVDEETFKRFILNRQTFFWAETPRMFFCLKLIDGACLRYAKAKDKDSTLWFDAFIIQQGGIRVLNVENMAINPRLEMALLRLAKEGG